MEPDKFEKHIKSKLNEREISPSNNAWEKIATQLETTENQKSNAFFWYSVAAVFIGILIVTTLYFNAKVDPIDSEIQIVDTPKQIDVVPANQEVLSEGNIMENQLIETQVQPEKPTKDQQIYQEAIVIATSQTLKLEETMAKVEKSDAEINEKEQLIDMKIAELVAQVDLLENKNLSISNTEIDSLLREAQNEILADKIFNQEGKVDAMALLNEVEGELDKSFREQIFESLKTGFLKVRTAVADRNN
ncbi:MAG: hypothetical protein KJN85_08615 [Maribacter sp.]|nr:hypothetical protein [Maribacter sp.]